MVFKNAFKKSVDNSLKKDYFTMQSKQQSNTALKKSFIQK